MERVDRAIWLVRDRTEGLSRTNRPTDGRGMGPGRAGRWGFGSGDRTREGWGPKCCVL
jgi:hypothetical protein